MNNNVDFVGVNKAYSNRLKINKSNSYKISQSEIKKNSKNKKKPISGAVSLGAGAYFGSKTITSGLRRLLGIRLETHTTSKENAKNIIKNGCVLDPKFGGNGASRVLENFTDNSIGSVHITGMGNTIKNDMENMLKKAYGEQLPTECQEQLNKIFDTPLIHPLRNICRKIQKKIYASVAALDIKHSITSIEDLEQIMKDNFGTKKKAASKIFDIITNRKSKTFYIGGTDKYFNDNFVPDVDDIALKTDKPLKVFKTKAGAIFDALKRDGLSGMKQNKSRLAFGAAVTVTCGAIAYKLIKSGLNKLGIIKKEEKPDIKKAP